MSDFNQRNYYKIFTGTNQEGGHDKIHLGYESSTLEITLKKDEFTYFHAPYFSEVLNLSSSTLIKNGAIAGPIPVFSDRIFKKRGGYGKSTTWGETKDETDGKWFCSWLYSLSGSDPIWVDRYYNPQYYSRTQLLTSTPNILNHSYNKNSVLYYDVPTELTIEPGVYYQYFHIGENTATEIVKTFAGDGKDRLRLSIENWQENTTDESIYDNTVKFETFKSSWKKNIERLNSVKYAMEAIDMFMEKHKK